MNKLLPIILIIPFCSILAQEIDTSQVKSIRYEWRIDEKTKDSTLSGILREYQSGLFKNEHERLTDEKTKFGRYFLDNSDHITKENYPRKEFLVVAVGDIYRRNYFDNYGNIDSIYQESFKNGKTQVWRHKIDKKYKRNGKLEYLINEERKKNVFFYNFWGKLKKIDQFEDSILSKISYFKNGLLTSEQFPKRKKYRKAYFYKYDKKNRIIKKDEDDYFFYRYAYNENGIERIEKINKKRNIIMEYELFFYNLMGQLIAKKRYGNKKYLQSESHYTYK